MNYAVRVTRPYAQIASWVSSLALSCDKLVVVEHFENCSQIHCHLHVWGYAHHTDTITNTLKTSLGVGDEVKGNALLSKKTTYGKGVHKKPVDEGNISYISKGKYDPKYLKGYTQEEYLAFKAQGYDKKDYHEGEKETPNEIYYNQFEKKFHALNPVWDDDKGCYVDCSYVDDFYKMKKYAYAYSIAKNHNIADKKSQNKFQMLVWTYSFRHDLEIPKDEKKWQI